MFYKKRIVTLVFIDVGRLHYNLVFLIDVTYHNVLCLWLPYYQSTGFTVCICVVCVSLLSVSVCAVVTDAGWGE